MTDYEILLMLDPELPEERQDEIVTRTRELVEKAGGTVGAARRLGTPPARLRDRPQGRGLYHLLTFDAEPETLDEISRILKITDGVMRHLAVRRVEGSAGGRHRRPSPSRSRDPSPSPPMLKRTSVREEE